MKFPLFLGLLTVVLSACDPSDRSDAAEAERREALVAATQTTPAGASKTTAPAAKQPVPAEKASPSSEVDEVPSASLTPRQQWEQFVRDFNARKPELAEWVPHQGLLVLDNPGAFVRVRGFSSFDALFALPGEFDAARIKSLTLDADVTGAVLPAPVDCEKDEAPQPGVFLGAGSAEYLVERVGALSEYELAPADEVSALEAPARKAADDADFIVHDVGRNVKFVFGEVAGRVKLLAIDMVVPCSA